MKESERMQEHKRLVERRAVHLAERYAALHGAQLLRPMIEREFPGRIVLASSFGSESAILLHMLAEIDPGTPVVFLNTGKVFGETLRYRDRVIERLGLTDIRILEPDPGELAVHDPHGMLFRTNPDLCCFLRKVAPLNRALNGFDAWITGRKAYHGDRRHELSTIEASVKHVKINPIAGWGKADVEAYFEGHGLPRHPLEAEGFTSIGCMPCTERVTPSESLRAGRWKGSAKTECGIHQPSSEIKEIGAST